MNQSRKSVLISGSAGLLGSKLSALYKQNGYFVGAIYRSKDPKNYDVKFKVNMCDIGDFSEIRDHFELIINCAGFTNVDENEKLPEKSWLENVVASNNLSEFARKSGSKFVHISTDHFLSDQNLVRDETATMTPVNQYGYTKLEAVITICKFKSIKSII